MKRWQWIVLGIVAWLACTGLIAIVPLIRMWVTGSSLPAAPAGLGPHDFYNRVYLRQPLERVGPQPALSLPEAARIAGFPVLSPSSLPAGFSLPPRVGLNTPAAYRMTIDVAAARSLLTAAGLPAGDLPRVPAYGEVMVTVQPVAGLHARAPAGQPPAEQLPEQQWFSLLQGRPPLAGVPSRVEPQTLDRLAVLGLRYLGLPEADAAAMAARLGWTWFLAFPPGDLDRAVLAQVNGLPALELSSSRPAAADAALIWVSGEMIYALYGNLPLENLHLMAESIR